MESKVMTTLIVSGIQSEVNCIGTPAESINILGNGDATTLAANIESAFTVGRVTGILSFGTSGGLDNRLRVGDILVGTAAIDGNRGGLVIPCDPRWRESICLALANDFITPALRFSTGTVTLANQIVADIASKQTLHLLTGADAVDEETVIAARAAAAHQVPFAIIRGITDPYDFSLPETALAFMGASRASALGLLFGNLNQIPELIQLLGYVTITFNNLVRAAAAIGQNLGKS
jgi:nucleoside phosphorylase